MTNDKLPEEIRKQINDEAATKTSFNEDRDCTPISKGQFYGYIAGATAWAPWKVKYEELKDKVGDLENEIESAGTLILAHDKLKDQAQRMADALEDIIYTASMDVYILKKKAHKALQQFKDGGKEVVSKEVIDFIRDIATAWDCDEDGHKNNTGCRKCSASELLYDLTKQQKEG